MKTRCSICNSNCRNKKVKIRDGSAKTIHVCTHCNYEFFSHNPSKSLSSNKLDKSRLNFDGLKFFKKGEEFKNGLLQSEQYFNNFMSNVPRKSNILEIGSSWGYFLYLLKKKNYYPYGVEISKIKTRYVKNNLKIFCANSIDDILKKKIKFKRIFLFYVLEYITNPRVYIKALFKLLDKNGQIIIITPNLNDPLKRIWQNQRYLNFFYEKHAINYFSKKSLQRLLKRINANNYKISTLQEYSFFNNLNWFFNSKPMPSNLVGKDSMTESFNKEFKGRFDKLEKKGTKRIIDLTKKINKEYKNLCEKGNFGNQIHLIINK